MVAQKNVNETLSAFLSPDSALNRVVSSEALTFAFLAAIDEFITGLMLVSDDRKEAFMRLYQLIDAIPAWVETKDESYRDFRDYFGD